MHNTHTEKELSIDTEAGLQSFLEYGDDVYRELTELLQKKRVLGRDVSKEISVTTALYQQIIERVASYKLLMQQGVPIKAEDVSLLQSLYNNLVTMLDALSSEAVSVTVPNAPGLPNEPQKHLTIQQTAPTPHVFAETSATLNDLLVAATTLVDKGDVLLHKYEELREVSIVDTALAIPRSQYTQLGVSAARAKKIKEEIFSLSQERENNRKESVLQHFRNILEEIDKTYEQLDQALDVYFEPEGMVPQKTAEIQIINKSRGVARIPSDEFSQYDERITDLSPYTKQALAASELRAAASEKYRTRAQLEAALKREIYRVEAPSKLDTVLGITYPSCFYTFLSEMTVEAILNFDRLPRENIRDALYRRGIPYEIYINWIDAFYDIVTVIQPPQNMKFGELFVRAELELLIDEKDSKAA